MALPFPHTETQPDPLERAFVRRSLVVFSVLTAWIWIYNEWVGQRYTSAPVEQLRTLQGLPLAQQNEIKNAAFSALQEPHFFSGVDVPATLLPSSDPFLAGVTEEQLNSWFASGSVFRITEHGAAIPRGHEWVSRARNHKISGPEFAQLSRKHPAFANTLWFINQGFYPSNPTAARLELCRATPSCVRYLIQTRHPDHYNALVVLYRYANGYPFTQETLKFARRRHGFFIRARARASELGYSPVQREEEALLSLQEVQMRGVHSMRTMAIFFTTAIVSLFVLSGWSQRRRKNAR